jgi:hypothetical protein
MLARSKLFVSDLRWVLLAAVFLALWGAQVVRSAWCFDESAHIPSGLYHLETGRMEAYRVNPPLPRMLAALPLLIDRPTLEWYHYDSPFRRVENSFAKDWLTGNQPSAQRQLILARATVLVFVAIGAWSIARWSNALYGQSASFFATAMWLLNPDVLTNSAIVAPDLPASAMGLLAGYTFWQWLKSSARPFPWLTAVAVASAILCKFTWLLLIPALPLITLIHDAIALRQRRRVGPHAGDLKESFPLTLLSVSRSAFKLSCSFSITLLLIQCAYGFDGVAKPLKEYRFIGPTLKGSQSASTPMGNRFSKSPIGQLPAPFPEQMMLGLDYLNWEFSQGMNCYVRGVWQHRGWWWFYLYSMAVKMPLGYWLLIAIGCASVARDAMRGRARGFCEWLPSLMAALFLVLVSSQTGFTHHVRYVLPVYGYLFITASRSVLIGSNRLVGLIVCIGLAGTIMFHITHIGLAHTYFNLTAGGPNNGWRHLNRSNIDWGQSGYRIADWAIDHTEVRPLRVLFCPGFAVPSHLLDGVEGVAITNKFVSPDGSQPKGWYLTSSQHLTVQDNALLQKTKPVAQPYPDILLFFFEGRQQPSQAAAAKIDKAIPLTSNSSNSAW